MIWTPQPGTVVHRAIEHLKTIPLDKTIASLPLAQAIGTDSGTLSACMVTAVKHGYVRREKKNGLVYWGAGTGAPKRPRADPDGPVVREAAGLDMNTVHRLAAKNNPFSGAFPPEEPSSEEPLDFPEPDAPTNGEDMAVPEKYPKLFGLPSEPIKGCPDLDSLPAAVPFQFSWCSDGTITLFKDGEKVVLTPREYGELARFISTIALFEESRL